MPFALVIAGISFFSLAGISSVWQFYVAYIIGRTITNPILIGLVPRTTAVNFFRRKRNIALSLAVMSRPITGAINIRLIAAFAVGYGWRRAYQYLGVLSLILTLPVIVVMRRRPEDIGLLPDGAKPEILATQSSPAKYPGSNPGMDNGQKLTVSEDSEFSWSVREALRTSAFWLVSMTAALSTLSTSSLEFVIVPYLHDKIGISIASAAGVLSISNFLAVTSLGWGVLADKFTPRRCFIIALITAGAMIIYLFAVRSLLMAYVFGVVWGTCTQGATLLGLMVLAQYFGRTSYGAIIGVVAPLQLGALGLGPTLGAVIRDVTGKYSGLQWVVIVSYLLAATLIFLARQPIAPRREGQGPIIS